MKKKIWYFFLLFSLFLSGVGPMRVRAEELCSLTVRLVEGSDVRVDGLKVSVYQLAEIIGNEYVATTGWDESGIALDRVISAPTQENAETIWNLVQQKDLARQTVASSNGIAEFSSLGMGLWLVGCEKEQSHFFSPYLVFLPYAEDGALHYHLTTTPKIEAVPGTGGEVTPVVPPAGGGEGPNDDPEVDPGEEPGEGPGKDPGVGPGEEPVEPGEDPEEPGVKPEEPPVEEPGEMPGEDPEEEKDKLPQTGQLWWPVLLLTVAGAALILLGVLDFMGKKDAKKN